MISIGEELKREREFREISLREISDATKINIRMLEAIEKDNFGVLPGGIFNRNFIRAYAEFIGLDPELIIRKYQIQTGTDQETKLPPALITPAGKEGRKITKKQLVVIFVAAVSILLAMLLLVWKFPEKMPFKKNTVVTPVTALDDSFV